MNEFAPWMFLVKIESGKKPRVCRVSPYEVIGLFGSHISRSRRRPGVWPKRSGGIAAIGNTVDEAFRLIGSIDKNLARDLHEVA